MFSKDVWRVCDLQSARYRQQINDEEEKRDERRGNWRWRVAARGVEIDLAEYDDFARRDTSVTLRHA